MSSAQKVTGDLFFAVFPNRADAVRIGQVITAHYPQANLTEIHDLGQFYTLLPAIPDKAVILIDLAWEGQYMADILISLLFSYPKLAFLIVSDSNPADLLPPYFPIPYVHGFQHTERLQHSLAELTEDLRGQQLGTYHIREFAGQSYLGRIYRAYQESSRVDVQLVVLPPTASAERCLEFCQMADAQIHNRHPQLYSVLERNTEAGRHYFVQEPVENPSLLQLALQGYTLDSQLVATILSSGAKVIGHLHEHAIPYLPIKGNHLTLSPTGEVRVVNTALPAGESQPDILLELSSLAKVGRACIADETRMDQRLIKLINQMLQGRSDVNSVIRQADKIKQDLAPIKHISQLKSSDAPIASRGVPAPHPYLRYLIWLTVIVATTLLGFVLLNLVLLLADMPGRDFNQQIEIPAGIVQVGDKDRLQTVTVGKFYIDQYEVTIGQYEKFLLAMEEEAKRNPDYYKPYLPPNLNYAKTNFVPADWRSIRRSLRKGFPQPTYGGAHITRDTPIFNIDYADAYAYAKWRGKRLPTELEWQRAAAGDALYPYPWGKEYLPENAVCNAYNPSNPNPSKRIRYLGPQIVDKNKTDRSPFGVYGMAGNVSEWVEPSPELGPLKDARMRTFKGANYSSPQLIPSDNNRLPYMILPQTTNIIALGFRCASDKPVP